MPLQEAWMSDALGIGLRLTVFGTGLVFLALALLWGIMTLLLALDGRWAATRKHVLPSDEGGLQQEGPELPSALVAAITTSILHHRARHGRVHLAVPSSQGTTATVASWVTLGRTRQMLRWPFRRR